MVAATHPRDIHSLKAHRIHTEFKHLISNPGECLAGWQPRHGIGQGQGGSPCSYCDSGGRYLGDCRPRGCLEDHPRPSSVHSQAQAR